MGEGESQYRLWLLARNERRERLATSVAHSLSNKVHCQLTCWWRGRSPGHPAPRRIGAVRTERQAIQRVVGGRRRRHIVLVKDTDFQVASRGCLARAGASLGLPVIFGARIFCGWYGGPIPVCPGVGSHAKLTSSGDRELTPGSRVYFGEKAHRSLRSRYRPTTSATHMTQRTHATRMTHRTRETHVSRAVCLW